MVLLPVLVLAERATVARGVASAARLASLATAVPAAFAGVLLLVDDGQCVLGGLSLGLGQSSLHLRPLS